MQNNMEYHYIIKLGNSPIAEITISNGRVSVYSYTLSRHLDFKEKWEFLKELEANNVSEQ